MQTTDCLFKQLHDANEKIKNLKLINECLRQDNELLENKISDYMDEISEIGTITFYEKYKEYKLF